MIEQYFASGSVPSTPLGQFFESGSPVVNALELGQYFASGTEVASYLLGQTFESRSVHHTSDFFSTIISPGTGASPAALTPNGDGVYPLVGNDPTVAAEDCIVPAASVQLKYNGSDYSQYYKGYNLSCGGRGQTVSGSIEIVDYDGHICEELSQFNESNSNMRAHNQSGTRYWEVIPKQAGKGPKYPHLLPGDPEWDGHCTTRIAVSDFTPLISKDNQSLPDVNYDEGDREYCHDLVADLCALAGVNHQTLFPNFMVRNFRFSGQNVISGLDSLTALSQAYRKWEGGNLVLDRLRVKSAITRLEDRFHIPDGSFSHGTDTAGLKTFFKAFRLQPMPTALSQPITGETVGRVCEVRFQEPVTYAIIWAQARYGSIEDGVFYDEDDNPVGQGFAFFGSAHRKAAYWKGTYVPVFARTYSYNPWWWIKAMGGVPPSAAGGDFSVVKALSSVEAIYGRREEYTNLTSEILLTSATATAMLEAIATEVMWSIRKFSISGTPFLAPAREGDFIRVKYYRRGIDEDLLLDNWSHSHSWESGYSCSYGLNGYMA